MVQVGIVEKKLTNAKSVVMKLQNSTGIVAQIIHGYHESGMTQIVRANDPFWNLRANHTVISNHSGLGSYPLICTMTQLAIDGVADIRKSDIADKKN